MTNVTAKGIEVRISERFWPFSSHEGRPAYIYFMKFAKFRLLHRTLIYNNILPRLVWDTTARSKSPTHISQQIDDRISKTIVNNWNKIRKHHQHARKLVDIVLVSAPRAQNRYTWAEKQNRPYKWYPIKDDHGGAASHWNLRQRTNLVFFLPWRAASVKLQ